MGFLVVPGLFSGAFAVSFREGKSSLHIFAEFYWPGRLFAPNALHLSGVFQETLGLNADPHLHSGPPTTSNQTKDHCEDVFPENSKNNLCRQPFLNSGMDCSVESGVLKRHFWALHGWTQQDTMPQQKQLLSWIPRQQTYPKSVGEKKATPFFCWLEFLSKVFYFFLGGANVFPTLPNWANL